MCLNAPAPVAPVGAVLLAAIVGLLTQARSLSSGDARGAWPGGFAPFLITLVTLSSLEGVAGSLQLPWYAMVPACVAAAGFWLVAAQRDIQGRLALRD